MTDLEIPQYSELLWPTVRAVSELGGSGSISEILEAVIKREGFTEEQQGILHHDGPETEVGYRLAWARTYLKGMGLLTNSQRGVWALTDDGFALLDDPGMDDARRLEVVRQRWTTYTTQLRGAQRTRTRKRESGPEVADVNRSWNEELLDVLMRMPPESFERLTKRLLREADFDSVNVTGRQNDGGIDGLGLYRLGLITFPVFFQCQRYAGSVGPATLRDFRGAMAGRADKGLLITTGTFTAEARKESTRDGAPPIDLIDGDRLCDLLKHYRLGVETQVRQVEDVRVVESFFREI